MTACREAPRASAGRIEPFIPRRAMDVARLGWRECRACTFCSNGSRCAIGETTVCYFHRLLEPHVSAIDCSRRCVNILTAAASSCHPAASWMSLSSTRQVQPRMLTASVISTGVGRAQGKCCALLNAAGTFPWRGTRARGDQAYRARPFAKQRRWRGISPMTVAGIVEWSTKLNRERTYLLSRGS
jgi:hypothetical protein